MTRENPPPRPRISRTEALNALNSIGLTPTAEETQDPYGQAFRLTPEASAIMSLMLKIGEERGICVLPVYAASEDAAATILDLSATMGVDYLIIGASQRNTLAKLLGPIKLGRAVQRWMIHVPADQKIAVGRGDVARGFPHPGDPVGPFTSLVERGVETPQGSPR